MTAGARLFSLIETATANRLEPYAYLRELFASLAVAESVEDIEALVPFNFEKNRARG